MNLVWIILIVAVTVAGFVIATYNFFVSSKARIKAAIQEIGNQLKRQADLIPNLEASTKGYVKHERGVFKDLTDARKQINSAIESGNLEKMAEASTRVSSMLPALKIAVEDNPELKASDVVSKLMSELRDTADKVMYARRLVIDLTADYNVKRVSFPSNIVANMFGFTELTGIETAQKGSHVEVSADEMKTPKIDLE